MRLIILTITLLLLQINAMGNPLQKITLQQTQILQHKYQASTGVLITTNPSAPPYYQQNVKQLFPPASLTKLFTASAALLYLKPSFRYRTNLYYTGAISQNTLHGDIYINFTGDPSLTSSNLYDLLAYLKTHHITRITGHIYCVANAFDAHPYPNGMTIDDLAYNYASPISSIIINENSFEITLTPTTDGSVPGIRFPSSLPVTFNNLLQQKNDPNCEIKAYSHPNNHYTLEGCVSFPDNTPLPMGIALTNPFKVAELYVSQTLQQLGIQFYHSPQIHSKPQQAKLLSTHRSVPLNKLIKTMLKNSNNTIANALFKTLGQHMYHAPGSWNNGNKALLHILTQHTPINVSQIKFLDGAGLSRYNLCTPKQIALLLQFIEKNSMLKRYIIPALPIAGVDGTLANRMSSLPSTHSFRAKTGSMTGVSNLAGFLSTPHHKELILVLMVHSFIPKVKEIRGWEDRLITNLVKNHLLPYGA
jgi:serine-type D-Ala-D-Ala carboxypeptidase/endopeptidase (penicillin-binding protein 4)